MYSFLLVWSVLIELISDYIYPNQETFWLEKIIIEGWL
jgi:hypothetical protein